MSEKEEGKYYVDVSKLTFEQLKKVRTYLRKLIEMGGSDLHIKAGSVFRARVNGTIIPISEGVFEKEDAITFAKELLKGRYAEFVEKKEIDLVYPFDEHSRFRVNVFFSNGWSVRSIPCYSCEHTGHGNFTLT